MSNEKLKTITKILGAVLVFLAIMMLPSLAISIYNKEGQCVNAFLIVALACAIFGMAGYKFIPAKANKLKNRDGFLVVSLTWIIASLIGALPFVISGAVPSFIDAWFESVSGFTTTGATVIRDVEVLPMSILFWRSLTQWIGGLGIILLITAFLPSFGMTGQIIGIAETTGPTKEKQTSRFADTAKSLCKMYSLFTVAEFIALKLCKMSWFDSAIHTLSSISTGGFSNYNDNVGHFDSPLIYTVLFIFMIIAAANINLLFKPKRVLKYEETKFFLFLLFVGGLLVSVFNFIKGADTSFITGFFQVGSVLSTTGFVASDFNLWPSFCQFILLSMYFVGSCQDSSGTGLKPIRALVGLKLIKRSFKLKIHPNRIYRLTLDGSEIGNDVVIRITNYIFAYIGMIILGTFLLSFSDLGFTKTFTACLACLGNVGPGLDFTGYWIFTGYSKAVCMFLMLLGRLEIYTVLALFSRHYWNSNRI
ncbi:MAG: TrkH family potassium uptake protein [Clostridia bacterium]|nr:TrkH family potassium uptake protein [Clostridia bacterium]